jgi:hypothetical protein
MATTRTSSTRPTQGTGKASLLRHWAKRSQGHGRAEARRFLLLGSQRPVLEIGEFCYKVKRADEDPDPA